MAPEPGNRPAELPGPTEAEAAFANYLRSRNIKFTKPRRVILRAVLRIQEHFEAEQLLVHLRQCGEKVAKATIYRTLPLLVDCGILKQVRFSDNQSHYEHAFGEKPHDHMVCRSCGRIIEFSSEGVVRLRGELAREFRFRDTSHRFQIVGVCASCADSGRLETNHGGGGQAG